MRNRQGQGLSVKKSNLPSIQDHLRHAVSREFMDRHKLKRLSDAQALLKLAVVRPTHKDIPLGFDADCRPAGGLVPDLVFSRQVSH